MFVKTVVIGMSGGVDSSVAAYLLKKAGYNVIGISFKFIDSFDDGDAINVCNKLGIEHYTIDYRDEFRKLVIDKFINDYKSGVTPNPCVICNRFVKMRFLCDQMIKFNADFIATGHYARIINGKLFKSVDINKDQSYFLSQVSKDILSKLFLPLEGIAKDEVRNIAREIELDVANKKDSTDVCFLGNTSVREYLEDYIDNMPGDIVNIDTNEVLGKHIGLMYYTIGQRRGLNIGGTDDRCFVVKKDLDKNILYVAIGDENKYLFSSSAIIEDFNFLTDMRPNKCNCKFRYRQLDIATSVEYLENNTLKLDYNKSKAVTPGQFCVLYDGDICLGGGIIKEVK